MTYASKEDIDLAIEVLKRTRENIKGTFTEIKLTPKLNRVIFELEALRNGR